MKRPAILLLALAFGASLASAAEPAPNTLTPAEAQAGWKLLWDGSTAAGWRSLDKPGFPAKGWVIKDGTLTVLGTGGRQGVGGGDIITVDKYASFELVADFKITPGANSGIKYFINPEIIKGGVGFEYQVLDDERHPDAKLGIDGNRTLGSLYDLIPAAKNKPVKPIGEWNTARIVVRGTHIEHWLNGQKILEFDRGSEAFQKHFAESKFKKEAAFGKLPEGHILLQDHGDEVSYRNLKIRVLPAP
jgi:hypothetical protein